MTSPTRGDFYVDDDFEEVLMAFRRGEPGQTVGRRGLDQHAQLIVDQAVARLLGPIEEFASETVELTGAT